MKLIVIRDNWPTLVSRTVRHSAHRMQ